MKTILLLVVSLLVATDWVFADEKSDLDDPKVREKILKEAIACKSLEWRGALGEKLLYQADKQTPYTGWRKEIYDNGKVSLLSHFKDGKLEGLETRWHQNRNIPWKDGESYGLLTKWYTYGQKRLEGTYKDGKREGLWTEWDKDGKVTKKTRYKNGVEVKE